MRRCYMSWAKYQVSERPTRLRGGYWNESTQDSGYELRRTLLLLGTWVNNRPSPDATSLSGWHHGAMPRTAPKDVARQGGEKRAR